MKLFVVHRTVPGYAREDPHNSDVVGVFTNEKTAKLVAMAADGRVSEVVVDRVAPGHKSYIKEIFGVNI